MMRIGELFNMGDTNTQLDRKSKKLNRGTVNFIHLLMQAGAKNHLFDNFSYDPDHPDLKIATLLASMVRISGTDTFSLDTHQFRPIAIGWWLKAVESKHVGFDFHDQFGTYNQKFSGTGDMLDQLQPAAEETLVTVLETKRTEKGERHIEVLCRYKTPKGDPKAFSQYLIDNKIAIGLGHAMDIVDNVILHPAPRIDDVVPLWGEKALGKSLFILTKHNIFAEMKDKVGTPRISWLELQIASSETALKDRCIVRLHYDLNTVIPVGSLVSLSNITCIADPQPRSD